MRLVRLAVAVGVVAAVTALPVALSPGTLLPSARAAMQARALRQALAALPGDPPSMPVLTTELASRQLIAKQVAALPVVHQPIAPVTWWTGGVCDPANANRIKHRLPVPQEIGSWDGLVACGPGPTQSPLARDLLVRFAPRLWGAYEWECVELSMRWMYLAWGVNPYPADAWDVVIDYQSTKQRFNPDGPALVAVRNGTRFLAPEPGDVVSIAQSAALPFGHTAVVTSATVNGSGNGQIQVIQEDGGAGSGGFATYPVVAWTVGNGVSGWLHNPDWAY